MNWYCQRYRAILVLGSLRAAFQAESELNSAKDNVKQILRRLNRQSEPQASIEGGQYTIQYDCIDHTCPFLR